MNAIPLTHITPEGRQRYSAWAERIARNAKTNRTADLFRSYAQIASDDGSFYGETPGSRAGNFSPLVET